MGADCYINSLYGDNKKKYEPLFNKWAKKRDNAKTDEQRKKCQDKIHEYYELMLSEGYFRDSYNSTSLLWQYDLSWWNDIGKMLNDEGELEPEQCKILLTILDDRILSFEENLTRIKNGTTDKMDHAADTDTKKGRQSWVDYFIKKDAEFRKFLKQAIRLDEAIDCSI